MNKIHTKKEVPSVELSLRQPIHRKEDFPMNDFTTEIVQTLVTKGDLNELFRSHLERAVNTLLLRTELTAFLEYEKYDRTGFNSGNSRNGSYSRSIKTEYGELTLETTIIHLFEKGVTMSEIADLIEKMYGHHYTPQTMSNMTKVLTEEVNAFKVRTLNDKYVAIFMDATYIPLKRQTVSKEAIYIAIGIREDGTKEVLSYAIAPTESTYVWNELLQDIYSRGVHDVLLFITDGLKGMKDTIHQIYPKAKYQHCCVHVSRNIAHKVRVKDRKEICDDFKAVYQASSKEEANTFLGSMIEKWQKTYPKVTQSLIKNQDLLTFYEFPPGIRRSIYSTNLIESFNKQIKKYSRRKEQFQNEESLERFLVSIFDTYNQKFLNRSHKGFQQVTDTLASMFTE